MKWTSVSRFAVIALLFPLFAHSQSTPAKPAAMPTCPVEFLQVNPKGVNIHVKNVTGKKIVGLQFYAAVANATETWRWVQWGPLDAWTGNRHALADLSSKEKRRSFNWNRTVEAGATKKLSWDNVDLYWDRSGGGVFVLNSVLFEDGSTWDEVPFASTCKIAWVNNHKKAFVRPIELPQSVD